ncbi:hypothetical protein, partial [Mesobacillus subterraneus]|uniref:hypothetical protein n=1 Tax=Mesobacillus subterraneus TaxID=285983 RepID=UPI0019D713BA
VSIFYLNTSLTSFGRIEASRGARRWSRSWTIFKEIFLILLKKPGNNRPILFWFWVIIDFHSRHSLSAGRQVSLLLASLKPFR